MNKINLLELIATKKIVPVVKLNHSSDAVPLGEALCRGGLPVAEVTVRTDAAEKAIYILKKEFPEMLVGAGTVIGKEQAKRALNAGASFLVSPGISRSVIEFALDNAIPVFPGVCTPSEIIVAMEYDIPVVKFFPAIQYGGLATVKALAAPFPSLKFLPTGGINADNLTKFLSYDRIIACGGSWMVKADLIDKKNFKEIFRLTSEAVEIVSGLNTFHQ